MWREPTLLGDERQEYHYDIKHAYQFVRALAQRLGVPGAYTLPGYEDALYHLWKEGTLPVNLDPLRYKLDDPEERRRLARILDRGLGEVVGYALPLKWQGDAQEGGWRSSQWRFRRQHMFLSTGDSPMGYRLPLDSLPWAPLSERESQPEPSLFAPRPPLRDIHGEVAARYARFAPTGGTSRDSIRRAKARTGITDRRGFQRRCTDGPVC